MKINIADLIQGKEILTELKNELSEINAEFGKMAKQAKITFDQVNKGAKANASSSTEQTTAADRLAKAYEKNSQLFDETETEIRAVELAMRDLKKIQDLELKASLERDKTYSKINAELKLTEEKLKKFTAEEKKNTDAGKEAVKVKKELLKEQAKYRAEQKEAIQIAKLEQKQVEAATGSYNALSAQYSLNKIALNKMSAAERETTEEGKNLVKQSAVIYEEMKRLQAETGNTSLNVGNYAEANRELIDVLGRIPGSNNLIVSSLGTIANSFDKGGEKTAAFTGKLTKLATHPIVAILLLVAGALVSVANAFFKSSKGAEVLLKIQGTLQGVMSGLSSIAGKLGTSLYNAFADPKQAVKDLWSEIKESIVDRVAGLGLIFQNMGKIIQESWAGNFGKAKDAALDLAVATQQVITGFTKKDLLEIAGGLEEVTTTVTGTAKAFAELRLSQRATRFENVKLENGISSLEVRLAKVNELVGDGTISFKANREAIAEAGDLETKIADRRIKIAANNLDLIRRERSIREANGENVIDLLEQEQQAISTVSQERSNAAAIQAKLQRETRQEYQDRLERDLDFEIDIFDKRKTISERQAKDETLSFEDRKKILSELDSLNDQSFGNQIAILQKFTDVKIDSDKLLNDSNAEYTRTLGLSEIIEGRALEIARDQLVARQDLKEATQELSATEKAYNDRLAAEAAKRAAEAEKQRVASAYKAIETQSNLAKSEIELLEKTDEEKKKLLIANEIDRLAAIRNLRISEGESLSDDEIQIITNQIQALKNEFNFEEKAPFSIYSLIGVNDPEGQAAAKEAFDFVKSQMLSVAKLNTQLATQQLEESNNKVQQAQLALQAEIALSAQGLSAKIDVAKENVRIAKEEQEERLKALREQQQVELALSGIQEISNLTLASTKIYSQVGNPAIAIPLIALMFGSYVAAKAKAVQLTKKTNRTGTFERLKGGGSHESGDDINIAYTRTSDLRAERNEGLSVWTESAMNKYPNTLEALTNAANNLELFEYINSASGGATIINMDNTEIVNELRKNKPATTIHTKRYTIVKSGNRTKKYIA